MRQRFLQLEHLKKDVPAGLVVFLIALPLCLGVALASGAPPFAGLITGIIGGMVVSLLSGSQLSVSGPAAGLTTIVLAAITTLGYENFLCSVIICGVLQLILGSIKAGSIALYFPSSVIKGMLAAIGLILIFKQIPHAFGVDEDYEGDFDFWQANGQNTLSELALLFDSFQLEIIVTSVISLIVLLAWDMWVGKKAPLLPAPLITVLTGVGLTFLLEHFFPAFAIEPRHMVAVPVANSASDFMGLFVMPDLSGMLKWPVIVTGGTLALVASLETLLSIEAIDKLDPQKRVTPTNRELAAQGIGNMLSGLLGGLPMTAVIVRGSANVNAGAKTRIASFFHGLFLLLCILFIPGLLNRIPFASLAVILIVIGYKLTKVSLYRDMYRAGWDQFIPFITTVLAITFTGLLWGIGIGFVVAVFYILRQNMRNTYSIERRKELPGAPLRILLSQEMSFLNKASIRLTLDHLPDNSKVIIDGSESTYIDYDVLEIIHNFSENAHFRDIEVELNAIPSIQKMSHH
jgi:MFS superfamily sulfate permease-like transporter